MLSALVPLVNAEVYALAVSTRAGPVLAVVCAFALALGQTGGKLLWYTSGRTGQQRRQRKRLADPQAEAAQQRSRLAALTDRLRPRRSSAALVFASGALGVPPLALVAIAAGATRMRLRDFLVCCFLGRAVRFGVLLLPLALHGS